MKKSIRFAFVDGSQFSQKLIFNLLSEEYECIIDELVPDILVYSVYNLQHKKYHCKKLFVDGENDFPNFNICDFAISQSHIEFDNRYLRLPFFVFNKEYNILKDNKKLDITDPFNRKFCSAVISNGLNADPRRIEFMQKLHQRKPIDSIGKCFNTMNCTLEARPAFAENLDTSVTNPSKIAFIKDYKFNLAMENSCINGYVTEKITDAYLAQTIPIYFGAPDIADEFDINSFIDILSFKTFDDAIDKILDINTDQIKYMHMLNSKNLIHLDYIDKLKTFLHNIIETPSIERRYGRLSLHY